LNWTRCALFTLFIFLGFLADAKVVVQGEAPPLVLGRTAIGFDMEISDRILQRLIPYFDLDFMQAKIGKRWAKVVPDEILNNYLVTREAFFSLPLELQTQLSEGLSLAEGPKLLQGTKILAADGTPLSEQVSTLPQLLRPTNSQEQALIRPNGSNPVPLEISKHNEFIKPKFILTDEASNKTSQLIRTDWPILVARWRMLPREIKLANARLDKFSSIDAAGVVIRLPVEGKSVKDMAKFLKLRSDAPEWLRELNFSLDSVFERYKPATFEMSLDGVYLDEAEMLQFITQLTNALRIDGLMKNPLRQMRMDVAFHWHISFPGANETIEENRRYQKRLEKYKLLMLMRILAAGEQNDSVLTDTLHQAYNARRAEAEGKKVSFVQTYNTFSTPIYRSPFSNYLSLDKGLLSLVEDQKSQVRGKHTEVREQTKSPQETLKEFIELISTPSDSEFNKLCDSEILATLKQHPDIYQRILKWNPRILLDLEELMHGLVDADSIARLLWSKFQTVTPGTFEDSDLLLSMARLVPSSAVAKEMMATTKQHAPLDPLIAIDVFDIPENDSLHSFSDNYVGGYSGNFRTRVGPVIEAAPWLFDEKLNAAMFPDIHSWKRYLEGPFLDLSSEQQASMLKFLLEFTIHRSDYYEEPIYRYLNEPEIDAVLKILKKQLNRNKNQSAWRAYVKLIILISKDNLQAHRQLRFGRDAAYESTLHALVDVLYFLLNPPGDPKHWFYDVHSWEWQEAGGARAISYIAGYLGSDGAVIFSKLADKINSPELSKAQRHEIEIMLSTLRSNPRLPIPYLAPALKKLGVPESVQLQCPKIFGD
jgi:hypothetical protein